MMPKTFQEQRLASIRRVKHRKRRYSPILPLTETRSALRRLLEQTLRDGAAYPAYSQQWPTIDRAARLGLIEYGDDVSIGYGQPITEAGRAWLADINNT
jgi:hypothetical protein